MVTYLLTFGRPRCTFALATSAAFIACDKFELRICLRPRSYKSWTHCAICFPIKFENLVCANGHCNKTKPPGGLEEEEDLRLIDFHTHPAILVPNLHSQRQNYYRAIEHFGVLRAGSARATKNPDIMDKLIQKIWLMARKMLCLVENCKKVS